MNSLMNQSVYALTRAVRGGVIHRLIFRSISTLYYYLWHGEAQLGQFHVPDQWDGDTIG